MRAASFKERHVGDYGGLNARVGNYAATWQGTIGRFRPGELNKKVERLLDFCALNDMVVIYQHTLPAQTLPPIHMVLPNSILSFRSHA